MDGEKENFNLLQEVESFETGRYTVLVEPDGSGLALLHQQDDTEIRVELSPAECLRLGHIINQRSKELEEGLQHEESILKINEGRAIHASKNKASPIPRNRSTDASVDDLN